MSIPNLYTTENTTEPSFSEDTENISDVYPSKSTVCLHTVKGCQSSSKRLSTRFWCFLFPQMRLEAEQDAECQALRQQFRQEKELLDAYQSKSRSQIEGQHEREQHKLQQKISIRRAHLEQKVSEEHGRSSLSRH